MSILPAIQHTPAFDKALSLMESGGPFTFITGRAGTGKSTLLKLFRETTSKMCPVLAPTGVAALNVNGETIHRFFRFAPGLTVAEARHKGGSLKDPSLYRKADVLIIDEISMVRADLMDCMDQFLRAARRSDMPFGGLRMVVIGDLYQLPPVLTAAEREAFAELYTSPYFFASHAIQELIHLHEVEYVELEKVYRQSDKAFVELLNAVRNRSVTDQHLKTLNTRATGSPTDTAIVLTSVNDAANALNDRRLRELKGTSRRFQGELKDRFPERETPVDALLELKTGARVMCLANHKDGRYVNGSLGWVKGFEDDPELGESVIVELDEGETISVYSHTWTVYRSVYNKGTKSLDQEKLGSYVQIPLKLAWAVTIHKGQGKTFDEVTIDLGYGAFMAGQTYVALSRCRSFEGLTLVQPLQMRDIKIDPSIVVFMTRLQRGLIEEPEIVTEEF